MAVIQRRSRKRLTLILAAIVLAAIGVTAFWIADRLHLIPHKTYTGEDFGIAVVKSGMDFNGNGVDDYTDILLGARKDAENKPRYDGQYWADGYPPENVGVCTDVIWRAFRNAGYCLKDMVDRDIQMYISDYPRVGGKRDSNIDFRRVPNLRVFFEKYAVNLTLDTTEIAQWQPGDIVTYGNRHIAIVSDKRNRQGVPYIIHNSGQPVREEDALANCGEISGHFRFDADRLEPQMLAAFEV